MAALTCYARRVISTWRAPSMVSRVALMKMCQSHGKQVVPVRDVERTFSDGRNFR